MLSIIKVVAGAFVAVGTASAALAQSAEGGLPKAEGPSFLVVGFAIGTIILFAALIYGAVQYRRRDPANESLTERKTKEVYRQGE